MHLKIITHERVIFDEDVNEIYTKTTNGEIGILKNHVPIMAAMDIGVTKAVKDEDVKLFLFENRNLEQELNELDQLLEQSSSLPGGRESRQERKDGAGKK